MCYALPLLIAQFCRQDGVMRRCQGTFLKTEDERRRETNGGRQKSLIGFKLPEIEGDGEYAEKQKDRVWGLS